MLEDVLPHRVRSGLHSSLCSLLINSTPAHDDLVGMIGWPGALLHCLEAIGIVSSPNHAQKNIPWYQRRSKSQYSEGMSVLTIHPDALDKVLNAASVPDDHDVSCFNVCSSGTQRCI